MALNISNLKCILRKIISLPHFFNFNYNFSVSKTILKAQCRWDIAYHEMVYLKKSVTGSCQSSMDIPIAFSGSSTSRDFDDVSSRRISGVIYTSMKLKERKDFKEKKLKVIKQSISFNSTL